MNNEFGADQPLLREQVQAALDDGNLPSEMEAPELIAFGLSDLPIAFVSVSSSDFSLEELKEFVQADVVPVLETAEGIANVQVTGGQELPEHMLAAAAEIPSPDPEPSEEPTTDSTGVPLPEAWVSIASSQGFALETTDDLTADLVAIALAVAPQLLADLTPEMILAAPQEVVDAVPVEQIAELSPEQQDAFAERGALKAEAVVGVPLPDSWISAAQAQGVSLATTADLIPQLVAGIASFAPQMLAELTPEMLLSTSLEALAALPQDFLDGLEPDLQEQLGMCC